MGATSFDVEVILEHGESSEADAHDESSEMSPLTKNRVNLDVLPAA